MTTTDESKTETPKDNTEPEVSKDTQTIFSQEELQSTVKAFILAYLSGQIKITFPSAREIIALEKREGNKINYKKASKYELMNKDMFEDMIAICVGTMPATSAQLQRAIAEVFGYIVQFRQGGRIDGSFLETDVEQRLKDLEKKLAVTNNVVEQLIKWLTEEAKADDKMS